LSFTMFPEMSTYKWNVSCLLVIFVFRTPNIKFPHEKKSYTI